MFLVTYVMLLSQFVAGFSSCSIDIAEDVELSFELVTFSGVFAFCVLNLINSRFYHLLFT